MPESYSGVNVFSHIIMTKAFFLINVQYLHRGNTVFQPWVELASVPSIKRVEEVAGVYDLLVEIETPGRLTEISELLMSKAWVKRLHVLRSIQPVAIPLVAKQPVPQAQRENPEPSGNTRSWIASTL